jgi:hypothetical protein
MIRAPWRSMREMDSRLERIGSPSTVGTGSVVTP